MIKFILFPFVTTLLFVACNNSNLEDAKNNPKSCTKLDLYSQRIDSVPEDIAKCENLTHLYLNDNKLDKFPQNILLLQNLKVLNLNKNNIKEIPLEIYKLKNLESLSLIYNNIDSLPKSIYRLKKLKYLNLSENPISFVEQDKIRSYLPNTEIHFEFASQLNSFKLYFERALEFYNKKDYQAAIHYCNKVIYIYPNHPSALSLRGFLNVVTGEKQKGCEDLQKASKLGDKQAQKFYKQFCTNSN